MADDTSGTGVASVTVRYFAAARAAAGTHEEVLSLPTPVSVGDVVTASAAAHGSELARVLARCSFLLNEIAVHGMSTEVPSGAAVDVLPPFAGG